VRPQVVLNYGEVWPVQCNLMVDWMQFGILLHVTLQLLHGPHTIVGSWLRVVVPLIGACISGMHSQDKQ
jgi:hypothetical protein